MFRELPNMPVTMTKTTPDQETKKTICQDALTQSLPLEKFGLRLRPYQNKDLNALLDIATYPTFSFEGLDGSRKMTQAFIASAIDTQFDDGSGERKCYALAIEDAARREVIGHIAAKRETSLQNAFDLSFFMHPMLQGHKLIKIASTMLIDGLFDKTNAQQIVASAQNNPAAQNILGWLGFDPTQTPSGYRLERPAFAQKKAALYASLTAGR